MQVVAEREVPDAPPVDTTTLPTSSNYSQTTTTDASAELLSRHAWRQGVLAALTVAIRILAVRSILLLAAVGAIMLAYIALDKGDLLRLATLGIYLVGALIPLVWLASRG